MFLFCDQDFLYQTNDFFYKCKHRNLSNPFRLTTLVSEEKRFSVHNLKNSIFPFCLFFFQFVFFGLKEISFQTKYIPNQRTKNVG